MARYDNVGRDARGLALCPVWFFGHICLFGASCIHPRLPPDGCEKVGKLVCVCSPQYENARKKKVPGLMCISGLRLLIFDTRGGGCRVCACVCFLEGREGLPPPSPKEKRKEKKEGLRNRSNSDWQFQKCNSTRKNEFGMFGMSGIHGMNVRYYYYYFSFS